MTVLRWVPRPVASCAVAGLVVAALAVAGCGTQQAGGGGTGGTLPATSVPNTSVPNTSAPVTTAPSPTPAAGSGSAVVVQGVIEKGVESGCYVLTPERGGSRYLLVTTAQPPLGVPVTVRGTAKPDLLSSCQQGTPLQVSTIERR